jgi:branched-chain amino acid transport system substrate-binding protein
MNSFDGVRGVSRRAFLTGVFGTSVVLLASACSAPPATPTATPAAAPKPTSAPPAAAAPTTAAKPTQQQAPAAGTAAGGTLKLGVLLPYSKVYAALGEAITNGMQLYFEQTGNTAGGRKIEIIKEDEENDPAVGLQKMRKMVEQDSVDLTTGIVSSAVLLAVRDYAHDSKVPLLVSNAGAEALSKDRKSPYIFRTSFTNQQPTAPMGEYVFKNQAKKVVTAAADYAAGREAMAGFSKAFQAAGGEIVAEVWPPFPNTDYAPFLEQIRGPRPEAVFCFFAGSDAVNFVKQFDDFGLKKDLKLLGSGFMLEQDTLPAQGSAALGGISGLHYATTLDNAENKKFADDYQKRFNKPTDVYAVQGYDTARVIVEAVNQTQGNTKDVDALVRVIEGISFSSPRGPFKMDPESRAPIHNIYAREVRSQNGQLANFVVATFQNVKDPA